MLLMKKVIYTLILFLSPLILTYAQENAGIPKGAIKGPFVWKSNIYAGTERNYWIHVPEQYDAGKPACLMVVQDGLSRAEGWQLPAVLDSLIASKEIPVMISVFIDHGTVAAAGEEEYPRFNRSFEYDAMGDRYARFLLEEILPEVEQSYNISNDPDDRSIAGASSGAIAAFNVAWERPDAFRRVLSTIGSYVGLRGGEEFPKLIRVTEPKPIRVFLEDGSNDLDIYAGGWWTANQSMLSALTWAGYEVNHKWGEGGHNSKHAASILPEALVWLWKDYPAGVEAHPEAAPRRLKSTIEGENWNEIPLNNLRAEKLAVNAAGEVYFTHDKEVFKKDHNGDISLFASLKGAVGGFSFNRNGDLYVGDLGQHSLLAIDKKGKAKVVLKNVSPEFISLSDKGVYFSQADLKRIGFYSFDQKKVEYFAVPVPPAGLALSAEQSFLNVASSRGLLVILSKYGKMAAWCTVRSIFTITSHTESHFR